MTCRFLVCSLFLFPYLFAAENPFLKCGVQVASERKLIPFEETVDPFLIQEYGGEFARRDLFQRMKLTHHDRDYQKFQDWYYGHFSWGHEMPWSFETWYRIWKNLMDVPWVQLKFNHVDHVARALDLDLSKDQIEFLWSLIHEVQKHPKSLEKTLEWIREQEESSLYENELHDMFHLVVNRILHAQLENPLYRGKNPLYMHSVQSLTAHRSSSFSKADPASYKKHQGSLIPIWDWKKPLRFHIRSPQRYVVRLLVRGPMELSLKGVSPSLHVAWQEWGKASTVQQQSAEDVFYIPKAGFYKFEFSSLVSQEFHIETHCRGRACSLPTQHYPVVFMHGLAGRRSYLGLIHYWRSLPEKLRKEGYLVEFPFVQSVANSRDRARSWVRRIRKILKKTGAHKVHLIGHSQGGLDARLLSSGWGLGQDIASITTLSTPHHGVDLVLAKPFFTGMDYRPKAMNLFNKRYPDPTAIPTLSYSGRTRMLGQSGTMAIALPVFWWSEFQVRQNHKDDPYGGANDGLVPRAAAQWGCSVGVIEADHLQQVWGSSTYDPTEFFREHLEHLIEIEALSEDFARSENISNL